jgi:dTDP-3,4-didehydro-2,6-dideoxy-alpha-D-glucose 3-reductase
MTTGTAPGQGAGIGVLGCADIAIRRAMPAIKESPFHLVAVASRTQEKAARVAARFGCKAATGYARILEMSDVDAVYIPLPNSEHAEWARRALNAGKHVLVEKPAVTTADAARSLVSLAEGLGLLVMENFAFLQHPQHDQARSIVSSGSIGDIRSYNGAFGIPPVAGQQGIRFQSDLCGGSLWEVGCYPVRAAQEYLEAPVQVLGASLNFDQELGVDIAGAALLRDSNGVTAHCSFGFAHGYRSTYDIWGSEGRLVLDWAFTPSRDARPVLRLQQKDRETRYVAAASDQFVGVMTAFFDAIRDPQSRPAHHSAMVRQGELMAQIRSHALAQQQGPLPGGQLPPP